MKFLSNVFRSGLDSATAKTAAIAYLEKTWGMKTGRDFHLDEDGDIVFCKDKMTGSIVTETNEELGVSVFSVYSTLGQLGDRDLIRFYRRLIELNNHTLPGILFTVVDEDVFVGGMELIERLDKEKIAYLIEAVVGTADEVRRELVDQYGMRVEAEETGEAA